MFPQVTKSRDKEGNEKNENSDDHEDCGHRRLVILSMRSFLLYGWVHLLWFNKEL
jgi:hypothetical protein